MLICHRAPEVPSVLRFSVVWESAALKCNVDRHNKGLKVGPNLLPDLETLS